MQGSLETPLHGIPKAAPWEQWETLEHKNKPAHFCASRIPIFFKHSNLTRFLNICVTCVQKFYRMVIDFRVTHKK